MSLTHSWDRPPPRQGSGDSRICLNCHGHGRWASDGSFQWIAPGKPWNARPQVFGKGEKKPPCTSQGGVW